MGEHLQMSDVECCEIKPETCELAEQAESMLKGVSDGSDLRLLYSVPIAELAVLGSGVASFVPEARQLFVVQAKIKSTLDDLLKKFQYYRLSLYTFSLAAFLEIMLSRNFKEEYISEVKTEIEKLSLEYRELFGKCSEYLERLGNSALEANLLKGAGNAGNAVGKFIGSIPKIKDGPVDEFLQDQGDRLKSSGVDMEQNVLKEFAQVSNPETRLFTEKMEDMIRIFNQTTGICFNDENIYLTAV